MAMTATFFQVSARAYCLSSSFMSTGYSSHVFDRGALLYKGETGA